jgi:hypothetical protein
MNKRRRWKAKARRKPRVSLGRLVLTGPTQHVLDIKIDEAGVLRILYREGDALFTTASRPAENSARAGLMRLANQLGATVYEPSIH